MHPHRHLRRLTRLWDSSALVFITACTENRRKILDTPPAVDILTSEWRNARSRHGWCIGRYVIMPDHVHFFCVPESGSSAKPLALFVGAWKEWSAKGLVRTMGVSAPVWQKQFFDHVLRSSESYAEKWAYVRENPVRARLVTDAAHWPYSGAVDFDDPL